MTEKVHFSFAEKRQKSLYFQVFFGIFHLIKHYAYKHVKMGIRSRKPSINHRFLQKKKQNFHTVRRDFVLETNVKSFTAERGHWQWPGGLL